MESRGTVDGRVSLPNLNNSVSENKFLRMNQIGYMDPTEEMNKRWLKLIQSKVPTIDLVDISAEVFPYNSHKRQFAPEYSYSSYLTMLEQEYAIGDYIENPNISLKVKAYGR